MTTVYDVGGVLGWPLDTFLVGSHNCMVIALDSCVKWPSVSSYESMVYSLDTVKRVSDSPQVLSFNRFIYIYI